MAQAQDIQTGQPATHATPHQPHDPTPSCQECGIPAPGGTFKNEPRDAVCPVCGMGVRSDDKKTPRVDYRGGQKMIFCCHACVEKFELQNRDYIDQHVNCGGQHA